MTKSKIHNWMNKQIKACEIQNIPVDPDDPFYINNASANYLAIHVYNIDNLCKELKEDYRTEEFSDKYDRHYIMYKGYKFFGLVDKEIK